jgi:hypothetical protein
MEHDGSAFGVVGVFLTLLGAGVILDADCVGMGASVMVVGLACLASEAKRPSRGKPSS